jgi:hypothetical protein
LPWPWSVPRLPFSDTARPNSDIVMMTVSLMRSAKIGDERARPRPKSSRRVASSPSVLAFVDVVVPVAGSANAISRPTSDLASCAICLSACPNALAG